MKEKEKNGRCERGGKSRMLIKVAEPHRFNPKRCGAGSRGWNRCRVTCKKRWEKKSTKIGRGHDKSLKGEGHTHYIGEREDGKRLKVQSEKQLRN